MRGAYCGACWVGGRGIYFVVSLGKYSVFFWLLSKDVSSPFKQLESVVCCGSPISRLRLIGCLSDSPYVPSSFISARPPPVPLQSYEGNIDYFTTPSHPRWLSYGKPRAFCPILLQSLNRCKPWRCVSAAV